LSARQVPTQQLICDRCGAAFEHVGSPVAKVRELAAKHGWAHLQRPYARSHWLRQVDLCPACPEEP